MQPKTKFVSYTDAEVKYKKVTKIWAYTYIYLNMELYFMI